ncbi:hypothetical protein F4779DRAFT_618982 [Xylariaceae sp. FL0662B]|nr:hypothetical protein F4779DRAFT_618982 [Xylariaceae sp. FL0662B]
MIFSQYASPTFDQAVLSAFADPLKTCGTLLPRSTTRSSSPSSSVAPTLILASLTLYLITRYEVKEWFSLAGIVQGFTLLKEAYEGYIKLEDPVTKTNLSSGCRPLHIADPERILHVVERDPGAEAMNAERMLSTRKRDAQRQADLVDNPQPVVLGAPKDVRYAAYKITRIMALKQTEDITAIARLHLVNLDTRVRDRVENARELRCLRAHKMTRNALLANLSGELVELVRVLHPQPQLDDDARSAGIDLAY